MSSYDYDLFVVGAGSGGVRAARMSGDRGARVGICEARYLGGTCVNVGCIPKKLLVYGAEFGYELEHARAYGWSPGQPEFDWRTLVANKNREIERLNGVYRRLLEQAGVDRVEGHATLIDPHTVSVDGRRITAEHILVATGSWPAWPQDVPGIQHAISSNEAFHLERLPGRVLIVGGGYIGVEFACIFNGLGSGVDLVCRQPQLLRGFDEDLRYFLGEEMAKKGITLHPARTLERIEAGANGYACTLSDGTTLEVDQVLCAVGRVPNTRDIGLEEVGVELGARGEVVVDDYFRSSVPSIRALGDVVERYQLTPVAITEGMAVAQTLFGDRPTTVDYENVPSTVFSRPSLGTVGLTEAQARYRCREVDIYRTVFKPLKHTLTSVDEKTLMKLVVERDTDRVLGVHMVGPDAGETIQGFAVSLNAGATKAQFDRTLGIHPTAAEEFVTMRTPQPPPEREAAE